MNVMKIEELQVQRAVDILVKAFADDPMFQYIFKTPAEYKKIAQRLFSAWVRWSMKYGVACITEDENGVMLLRKIGTTDMTLDEMIETGFVLSPSELGPDAFQLFYMEIAKDLEEKHTAIMGNTPHWYLWMLGADQEKKGSGSLLLQHGIHIADNDDLPFYLETSIQSNVTFYSKRGFELKDELNYEKGSFPFYFMMKPAKTLQQ